MVFKNVICACSLGLGICVFTFRRDFKLQFSHVGGCAGQPLSSKSILKVKTQIPIPKEHAQITFLNPIDCFLSQITIYNFPICPGSPCKNNMQQFHLILSFQLHILPLRSPNTRCMFLNVFTTTQTISASRGHTTSTNHPQY